MNDYAEGKCYSPHFIMLIFQKLIKLSEVFRKFAR